MGKNQPLIAVYHHLSVEPVRHIGSPPEEGHREVSTHSQSAEVSTDVKDVVARFAPVGSVPVTGTSQFSQPDTSQNKGFCVSKKEMYPI